MFFVIVMGGNVGIRRRLRSEIKFQYPVRNGTPRNRGKERISSLS